ncbi:hypothetical protein BDV33DRAFT_28221 [Aspergillus novoparasiticus]|uniref:Uncharacterized protein n=1 Tax=Aspergillus novoparasiticus TaxID=986946 RepID=A0A5N6EAI9_9EURO|nr:hypothetical protein BDV33DRAFT_28221 [Aspergillus novoparasiticus]
MSTLPPQPLANLKRMARRSLGFTGFGSLYSSRVAMSVRDVGETDEEGHQYYSSDLSGLLTVTQRIDRLCMKHGVEGTGKPVGIYPIYHMAVNRAVAEQLWRPDPGLSSEEDSHSFIKLVLCQEIERIQLSDDNDSSRFDLGLRDMSFAKKTGRV